ncbi:MAG: hypothetical protein ACI4BI_01805 [Anaerotardibacter sp.]
MAKNTVIKFEMDDESKVKLTLAYKYVIQLRGINRELYENYNKVMIKGPKEEIDNITVLYAAYMCGCISEKKADSAMSWDEFIDILPCDREAVNMAVMELVYPKKAKAFAKRLADAEANQM